MTRNLKQVFKRGLVAALALTMLVSVACGVSASAFIPYSTYTYDFDGNSMESPHGYVASDCMNTTDMELELGMSNPSDIFIDSEGYVYVADTGNSRIVFFDSQLKNLGFMGTFYNQSAIIPYVQDEMKKEIDGAEKKLARRLENMAEDEDHPVSYKFTLAEFDSIEKRMSAAFAAGENAALSTEYAAILAEFSDRNMPDLAGMLVLMNAIYPIKYNYDALSQEKVDAAPFGDTDEEHRAVAYYQNYLYTTENDPSSDSFNEPEGVFVDQNGLLYVADTGNARVVVLEKTGEGWDMGSFIAKRTIKKPNSSILEEKFEFRPMNLVLDSAGRMYVNVKNDNSGIMQLSADGEFMGYYGAQQVTSSVWQWFVQLFQTDEQRARTVRTVPRVYNNISIDYKNFVWVTANSMDQTDLFGYLSSGGSATAPIKRLNPAGTDVLVRNGTWAPGGDVPEKYEDVSSIIDVAVKGETGIYTLVDDVHNKLFTYDSEGELLYAFGGTGRQLGLFQLVGGAVYQGTDLIVLDKGTGYITRFKQTDYATLIETALTADDDRQYELSEESWKEVQKLNANLDLAYIGLAKCYLHRAAQANAADAKGLYQKSMEYYKLARNTDGYSKAFKEYRSLYVRDHLLLVLLIAVAIIVAIYFAVRALNKQNAKLHVTGSATSLGNELCYGWRAIFHPFNGFWEIKREKRGTMRAALIFLLGATLAFCFQATGTAYLFNNVSAEEISIVQQAANVLLPAILWVLASWAFTTLMSGEGSMKDIFIAMCYGLIPLIILLIPTTLFSNICSLDEGPFLTFFTSVAYGWMAFLIICGSMVVQDYTFSKNLLTVILSILGMAAIMFIVMLLISLTGKMFSFFGTIYQEIAYRL